MKVLDLFCGAGGASAGYYRAGFRVVGIDDKPQPDYPFEFIQADAMEPLRHALVEEGFVDDFDLVHASPPCQLFTRAGKLREAQGHKTKHIDLLTPTLEILSQLSVPYIVENVPGSPMRRDVMLCGSMFGLKARRHRWFQTNMPLYAPGPCRHKEQGRPVGVYHVMGDEIPGGGRTAKTLEEGQQAMGIDWMPWNSLKEAIPPAYTEWLGLLAAEVMDGTEVRAEGI